jgi:hypothetical protein
MTRLARKYLSSRSANAAVEFAIVLPVLMLFAGSTTELGRAFQVYDAANELATQYAIAWADCSDYPTGACSTEMSSLTTASAIANIAPQLTTANVTLQMFQVQMSGTTPTVIYAGGYPASASTTLSSAQTAAAAAAFADGQSGIIVTVSYAHSLLYFPSQMSSALNAHLTPTYTITQLKS